MRCIYYPLNICRTSIERYRYSTKYPRLRVIRFGLYEQYDNLQQFIRFRETNENNTRKYTTQNNAGKMS